MTVCTLLKKLKQQSREMLDERRPALIQALEDIGDFYLELKWDFQSWGKNTVVKWIGLQYRLNVPTADVSLTIIHCIIRVPSLPHLPYENFISCEHLKTLTESY